MTSIIFDSFELNEVYMCGVLYFCTCISCIVFVTFVFWSDFTFVWEGWLFYWRQT